MERHPSSCFFTIFFSISILVMNVYFNYVESHNEKTTIVRIVVVFEKTKISLTSYSLILFLKILIEGNCQQRLIQKNNLGVDNVRNTAAGEILNYIE